MAPRIYCLIGLIISPVLLITHRASAQTAEQFFQSLQSPHLQIRSLTETQQIRSKTDLLETLGLTWEPHLTMEPEADPSEDNCTAAHFRQELVAEKDPAIAIKNLWQNCEPQWRENSFNVVTHSERILRTAFEPTQHPSARLIEWQLENNIKVPGLLFLKGPIRRPLVIIRTGIFSSLKTAVAERFLVMQLFEEGPYHLLLLPSTSGGDYIERNHRLHFGGFDEGLQTARILDLLAEKKEPLNRYISKIHLVGISLGGHGLWLTHFLQDSKNPLLDRTLLLCPAVDLQATAASQKDSFLAETFVKGWFSFRLAPFKDALQVPNQESISEFLERSFSDYQNPSIPWKSDKIPLPIAAHPYWVWNDFWSFMPTYYNFSKTFVAWTAVDPVVPADINARSLRERQQAPESALLEWPRGFHCSLPSAYQWSMISLSLRGYLDAESAATRTRLEIHSTHAIRAIDSLQIRRINLTDLDLNVELRIRSKPPLAFIDSIWIKLPRSLTSFNWVLENFNETLHQSVIRELNSRMSWEQEQGLLKIYLYQSGEGEPQ
jgi:hypothetical protein